MEILISSNTLASLEFDQILERLSSFSFFKDFKFSASIDQFFTSKEKLANYQNLVGQLDKIYRVKPISGFLLPEILPLLKNLIPDNSTIEAKGLYAIATFLNTVSQLKEFFTLAVTECFNQDYEAFPILQTFPDFSLNLTKEIFSTFDSEGEILSTHPDMVALYKERSDLNSQISELSSTILSNSPTIWQENLPVVRNSRVLLPLKNNFKGQVSGVIQEISATGNTLFIEPTQMVELNNKMQLLENKARQIHQKWVAHFCKIIHQDLEAYQNIYNFTKWFDGISSRARYSVVYDCSLAKISDSICLPNLIHPMLAKSGVPSEIDLNSECKLVVVSGANAGGKSVFLKSVALAIVMNQYGLFVHASGNPALPIFNQVAAILGDNQSISQGSSTFSGYMRLVASVINSGEKNSFVVLDELGSATEPKEGGALAVAILEELMEMGNTIFVSTHLQEISSYAASNQKALNATVLFDEKSNSPTYKIAFGKMGLSRAIETAQKNNIPPQVISRAKNLLEENSKNQLALLNNLAAKEIALDEQSTILNHQELFLQKQKEALASRELELKTKEYEQKRASQSELANFVAATKRELKGLTNQINNLKASINSHLQEQKKLDSQSCSELFSSIKRLENEIEKSTQNLSAYYSEDKESIKKIGKEISTSLGHSYNVGMKVSVGKYKKEGVILKQERDGHWLVQLENMKISIHEGELRPLVKKENKQNRVEFLYGASSKKASYQLDLRGMRVEEALSAIDSQIDLALLNGLREFSIIHGLGTGALKQAVRNHLKTIGVVRDFCYASCENGGYGKTEVVLDI